jgi:hypothetical protein
MEEEKKPKKKYERKTPRIVPMEERKNLVPDGAPPRVEGGGVRRSAKPQLSDRAGIGGGYRENSGRPRGGKNLLTVKALLEAVEARSGGEPYADLLVQDFLAARQRQDHPMVVKYHQLILQKVMNTLVSAEVTDQTGEIEAKKAAFSDALANLVAKHSTLEE